MIAIHDQFTRQMCDRLTTTCLGLGLVRLLQDARRFEEAKTTLLLLEDGVPAAKPSRKSLNAKRITRPRLGRTKIEAA
jgi:predicted N-formylglutamate amidohydrolase